MKDLMIIIALTLACCLAVGLIGLALLYVVRYRSLRQQLTIATLLPVVAVATTVLINVQLMFLSAHDSLVILIALLTSLLLAALGAWLVLRRISHASRRVGAGLHHAGDALQARVVLGRVVGAADLLVPFAAGPGAEHVAGTESGEEGQLGHRDLQGVGEWSRYRRGGSATRRRPCPGPASPVG